MSALARAGQDNAVLLAVRKQMEALEDKLSTQINRVQQQGDKLREAAFSRYDSKLDVVETNHPKMERRLAELAGSLRGLSDEMQNQIRRIHQTDTRLYEWRSQLEEEIRAKLGEIEQNQQNMASTIRVHKNTNDDSHKKYNQRLMRLEALTEERLAGIDDINQSVMQLHARLREVEDAAADHARHMAISLIPGPQTSLVERDVGSVVVAGNFSSLETQANSLQRQIDGIQAETNDMVTRMESQEERYKSLRTFNETKEEQYRTLTDRLARDNVEGRLREVQARTHGIEARMQEFEASRVEAVEQMDVVQRRLDGAEAASEELGTAVRRLQDRGLDLAGAGGMGGYGYGYNDVGGGAQEVLDFVSGRLKDLDDRAEEHSRSVRADDELSSRVASLVAALKDVAPKVINHENCLKQVELDIREVQSACKRRHEDLERVVGESRGRLEHLTTEVSKMAHEVGAHSDLLDRRSPRKEEAALRDFSVGGATSD